MVGVAHFSGWTVTEHNCAWSCIEVTTVWRWPNMNWILPPPSLTPLGWRCGLCFYASHFGPFSVLSTVAFFEEHNCGNHAQIRGKTSSSGLEWKSGLVLCSMPNQTLAWKLLHSIKIIAPWFFSPTPKTSVQNKIHILDIPVWSGPCVCKRIYQ